ncbi:MAG TPA: GDSL-type esterase/lipase family protein [Vicinamibacterales bacterium]
MTTAAPESRSRRFRIALGAALALTLASSARQFPGAQAPQPAPARPPNPYAAENAADHRHMMEQLGIRALRPGPSGDPSAPNSANYDEALANPFPELPDPLTLKDGRKVTTAEQWWKERRPEIVEDFEREVYGRVPPNVPAVTWSVVETAKGTLGGVPVVGRQVVGRVDNSAHPAITVEIQLTVVTPAAATTPVPLMIRFRGGTLQQAVGNEPPPPSPFGPPPPGSDPPATEQLIAAGWGFAFLNPWSIQADNGAGLTKGIIGLVNRGERRKPEDWGALRAWAWGASRALDFFERDPSVDATRVGIEGVSRYGKAALVTMAFDQRFAVVLVGSSGEGGAKLHRRRFGEQVENLTGAGQYHWMAGNFLKYGAADATFGSMNAGDLPVDAHQLIALCAPRPTFISYGIPEKGDAKWLDQQGSFMAAVAAGPVFRLLGARDLGTSDDYMKEKMPPVNTGLLDGQLAWRQHDGGHTDGPNWKYFIPWANRMLARQPGPATSIPAPDRPSPRTDANSMQAHADLLAKARAGRVDVYFVGDSITRRWGALDYPEFLAHWRETFHGWHAGNFAWGGDRTENILWRLENGELDGVNPKVIVIQAGTNNVGREPGGPGKVEGIVRGIRAIVETCRRKAPGARIVLVGIFPRRDSPAVLPEIAQINAAIAKFADGSTIRFLSINDRLSDARGLLCSDVSPDGLHLSLEGYRIWAEALTPILRELLGPPAATDLAPPPTGDPGALNRRR